MQTSSGYVQTHRGDALWSLVGRRFYPGGGDNLLGYSLWGENLYLGYSLPRRKFPGGGSTLWHRVEWSGDEYTAKVLVMGDDQQAWKAEVELLKCINQDCESDDQPPAKKPRLLKRLTKKTAASKPKNKSKQKISQPKAKRGKKDDFSLDLGSPAKDDSKQQSERSEQLQNSRADQNQSDHPERERAISEQSCCPATE